MSPTELDLALEELKSEGCSIAIVGDTPTITLQELVQRLFGHPNEDRERVLVTNRGTNSNPNDWLPDGATRRDDSCHSLQYSLQTGATFDEIVDSIQSELEALRDREPEAPAGRFRCGIVHTSPFIHQCEKKALVSGFTTLADAVHEQSFMGFSCFPISRDSSQYSWLESLFDITVEVRPPATPSDTVQQRWQIDDYGETPWFQL